MKVSIIGSGYVGLVSGVCLAEVGHEVLFVDSSNDIVNSINEGVPHFYEPKLSQLMANNHHKLSATTSIDHAVKNSDLTFIAVGTPFDGSCIDLAFIKNAASQIGKSLKNKTEYHVVVVKSTVTPGTTDNIVGALIEQNSGKFLGKDYGLSMNPEFLREGSSIDDFMKPDRIVIGVYDSKTEIMMRKLYQPFSDAVYLVVNNKTAEMIKYASNSLFATMISFSNEFANLCAIVGDIDSREVMRGVHLDRRNSPTLPSGKKIFPGLLEYLVPGPGFGGSCFPKDLKAISAYAIEHNSSLSILDSVVNVNNYQPLRILELYVSKYGELIDKQIALIGIAFKPDTDDIRESPSLAIVRALMNQNKIQLWDEIAKPDLASMGFNSNVSLCADIYDAIGAANVVIVMNKFANSKKLHAYLAESNPNCVLIDPRRVIDNTMLKNYITI